MKSALVVIALTLVDCGYTKRDTCEGDLCIGNRPPVAVIADAVSGTLRIGASGTTTLDAKNSYDLDGDALTYVWTTTCSGAAVADGSRYEMTGITADCSATVTVTDVHGASAQATVAVNLANIDAYVSSTSCLSTYDHLSGGTADAPFCTLALAMQAAVDVRIDAVKLDVQVHEVTTSFVLAQDITIRGGYDRANSWARGGGITSIRFVFDPAFPSSGFVAQGGAEVHLEDLELFFAGACPDNCALVTGLDTSLTLDNVTTGTTARVATSRPIVRAPGHTYSSVFMAAPQNTTSELHIAKSHFHGAGVADLSASVVIVGAVDSTIEDSTIDESGVTALGVFTRNAGTTVVRRSAVNIDGGGSHDVVGIWDGLQNDVAFPSTDTCPQDAPCESSQTLRIDASQVTVKNGVTAFAVAALGTENLIIEGAGTAFSVGAQAAIGVLTSAVGSAKVTDAGIFVVAGSRGGLGYGVGYSDNFAGDNTLDSAPGSRSVTLESCVIDLTASDALLSGLFGANLIGTDAVVINDTSLTLNSPSATTPPQQLAGLHTARVGKLESQGLRVSVDGNVQHSAYAITDGTYDQAAQTPVLADASSQLTFLDPMLHVHVISTDSDSIVAGAAFSGTQGVTVRGTRTTATNIDVIEEGMVNAIGVFTIKVDSPVIDGLGVRSERIERGADTTNGAIGIADGNPLLLTSSQSSTNLSVTRNRIDTNGHDDFSADIFTTGTSQNLSTIADNYFTTSGSGRSFGVIFVGVGGTVRFNTFRLVCGASTSCVAVSSAFNVGGRVEVLGNTLTVRRASLTTPQNFATMVAECNFSASARTVDRIAWNLYHCDSDKPYDNEGKISIYRTGVCSGATQDASSLNATVPSGTVAMANQEDKPAVFCGDATWHGAPNAPQVGYVNEAFVTENDIDGDSRGGSPPYDAGADVVNRSVCP